MSVFGRRAQVVPPRGCGVHLRLTDPPAAYLASSEWIDHAHPAVRAQAAALRGADARETTARAFAWVRDEVRHAGDHRAGPTTCRASDVLAARAGWCFAKSHLLVAMLRANGIPAGLAYQRLALDVDARTFTLHGLVAAQLPGLGWSRMDPRGDKPGISTAFDPPREHLAFSASGPGERDLQEVRARPLPSVVACLTQNATWERVLAALPDEPFTAAPCPSRGASAPPP